MNLKAYTSIAVELLHLLGCVVGIVACLLIMTLVVVCFIDVCRGTSS